MKRRFLDIIKRDGIRLFLVKLIAKTLGVEIGIRRFRQEVWSTLSKAHNHKVAYGPFKGMSLPKNLWWGDDRITQTLGIYEEHVLKQLIENRNQGATKLIDIGAADGYFAIGMTFSKIYQTCIAFEISEEGRKRISENAKSNRCEDCIEIHGEADLESLTEALSGPETSTVLIDIEGCEYDLLNDKMLKLLSDSFVICELHNNLIDDGLARERALLQRASKYFNTSLIKRETYNPNAFSELNHLDDTHRLIAVSEGRSKNTEWLVCSPL